MINETFKYLILTGIRSEELRNKFSFFHLLSYIPLEVIFRKSHFYSITIIIKIFFLNFLFQRHWLFQEKTKKSLPHSLRGHTRLWHGDQTPMSYSECRFPLLSILTKAGTNIIHSPQSTCWSSRIVFLYSDVLIPNHVMYNLTRDKLTSNYTILRFWLYRVC